MQGKHGSFRQDCDGKRYSTERRNVKAGKAIYCSRSHETTLAPIKRFRSHPPVRETLRASPFGKNDCAHYIDDYARLYPPFASRRTHHPRRDMEAVPFIEWACADRQCVVLRLPPHSSSSIRCPTSMPSS